MKRYLVGLASLLLPLIASNAFGAACDLGGYTVSPDLSTYSLPNLNLAATDGSPDGCALSMPIQVKGKDTVSLFTSSYTGEVDGISDARVTVQHNGVTDVTDDPPDAVIEELASGQVVARGNTLTSNVAIELTGTADVSNAAFLDTADFVLLTSADLYDLSLARTGIVTHLNGTTELLRQSGQPLDGPDGVSFVGGVGSVTLGVSGQQSLGNGFSVLGSAAYFDQATTGAQANGALLSAGGRYVAPDAGQFYRPYFEAGAVVAPTLGATFGLTYTSPSAATLATALAGGSYFGGYVEGGVLIAPTPDDKVVLSASLARDWLSTSAFTESSGGLSITQAAQTGTFDTLAIGAEWIRKITPVLSVTLSGGLGRTIAENEVASTIGAENLATAGASEGFARYGVKASYEAAANTTLNAFAFGTTGELSGAHLQVGGGVHVSF